MRTFRSRFLVMLLLAAAATATSGTDARAAEFTAEITVVNGGNEMNGRIYVKDSVYRMDMTGGGTDIYITVNDAVDTTTIFNTRARQYMKMPALHPQSLMNDPLQALQHADSIGTETYLGIDTINGYACEKYQYTHQGAPYMTGWIAQALGFPIRAENHRQPNTYLLIENIEESEIDPALFEIPEGYQRHIPRGDMDASVPENARTLEAGSEFRLPMDPNKFIVIEFFNVGEGAAECVVSFYREGAPVAETIVGPEASRTIQLETGGTVEKRTWEAQADEVEVTVGSGRVAVDITQP